MVKINSGAPDPTDRFENTPKAKWKSLLNAKRSFIATNLEYDCRCLIEFCEEAELVYADLGFKSAVEMIREGYELEPSQVELAVAWLKANGTEKPVPLSAAIAEARVAAETVTQGKRTELDNNLIKSDRGPTVRNTLKRLARDAPEMLDRIESGELSVNAAAIQAGIRKKPTPEEICVREFKKCDSRLRTLKVIVESLEPHERAVVMDWLKEPTDGR